MATANPVAPSGASNLTSSTAPAPPHDPAREKVQVFMAELTQVEALEEAFNLFLVHRADLDQANEEMQLEVSHIIFMTLFYDFFLWFMALLQEWLTVLKEVSKMTGGNPEMTPNKRTEQALEVIL